MDADALAYPTTLMELMFQHTAQANRQRKRIGPKEESKQKSSGERPATLPNDLPLVEEHGLVLRIISSPPDSGTCPASGQGVDNLEALASTFRTAFIRVWKRIPEADRRGMLTHWRRGPCREGRDDEPWRQRWPLIQIVIDEPSSSPSVLIERDGNVLTFPTSLVLAPPHELRSEMTRALAKIHHLSTGEHARQVMTLFEEPLDRWERRQGARATEAMLERKTKAVRSAYLRAFEASISQIVRRWGIKPLA